MGQENASRFVRSIFGRQQMPDMGMEETGNVLPIRLMVEELLKLDDETFGFYAWSREPLERKFDDRQKRDYIQKASDCGREEAVRLKTELGTAKPQEIAQRLGFRVTFPETPNGGGHVIFAQYVEPDEITVFMDSVKKADRVIGEHALGELLFDASVLDLLLAHEIFHGVEFQNRERIFTRTEKVELWRKPFSNRSEIICLSEIAGMAFARELLGLPFSPYLLDVLLMYGYQKEAATALYGEIMEFAAAWAEQNK